MKIEQNSFLRKHIIQELKIPRSPDEIAGRMKEENWSKRVSGDAIYRWLRSAYGQRYCKYLCAKRYNKKHQSKSEKRHIIPNMTSIHSMSRDLEFVTEGDTFLSPRKISKTSAVLVVWKDSKLLKGDIIKSLRPIHTTRVMKNIHKEYTSDAMILDQGGENREYEKFGVSTYFCDPASPRQKPLIESSIGLCRRWFWPKGTNLANVSREEFQKKIEILNNKYRKTLHYRSANEVSRERGIIKNVRSNLVSELRFTPEFTCCVNFFCISIKTKTLIWLVLKNHSLYNHYYMNPNPISTTSQETAKSPQQTTLEVVKPIKTLGKDISEKIFSLLQSKKLDLRERIKTAIENKKDELIINVKFDLKNTTITTLEVGVITSPQNFLEELKKAVNITIAGKKLENDTEYEITSIQSDFSFGEYEGHTNITIV